MGDDIDAFAEKVFGSIQGALELAGIYLGDKLDLYRAVGESPSTSGELAERAGIHERYAREWLEHQAANGYLTVEDVGADHAARRYVLPAAHAAVLLDRDSIAYSAGIARALVASLQAMPELMEAFRTGGGVTWERFGDDMLSGQSDTNRPLFLSKLGSEWLPLLPQVDAALRAGGRVADIGCGTGWSSIAIALAYPDATVDGFDIDEWSVDHARQNAVAMGVADRVTFHALDAAEADPGDGYDLVQAIECIHDMPYPSKVLASMRRLAADRGLVMVVDEGVAERFEAPANDVDRLMYGFSLLVCLPDGMSSPGSVGTGTVMRPDTLRRYAQEAGFADIEVLPISHDVFRAYRLTG
ncbi:MAG: methyltransferase domain-containing protein [Actinomycetota bacterium]